VLPQNVLVNSDGVVRLSDFGISRQLAESLAAVRERAAASRGNDDASNG